MSSIFKYITPDIKHRLRVMMTGVFYAYPDLLKKGILEKAFELPQVPYMGWDGKWCSCIIPKARYSLAKHAVGSGNYFTFYCGKCNHRLLSDISNQFFNRYYSIQETS